MTRRVVPGAELERGRASYAARSWRDAHEALSSADRAGALAAPDLELLATSAYMLGREDEWISCLERAHHAHLAEGEGLRAVRCALWVGIDHAQRGEVGPAAGWLGRARRLLEHEPEDCVERGYVLLPDVFRFEAAGEWEAAAATAGAAAAIGKRLGDADLAALATHAQGHILAANGRVAEGLELLDEAMVELTTREISPIVAGLVYCGVILACQEVYEVQRAREWTAALTRWCEGQPGLVAFTGRCLVHRAEILQLTGEWPEALTEATTAAERLVAGSNRLAAGEAFYRAGELHRVRGDLDDAERAYRDASRCGREPQPGLALLRLAQGRRDDAAVAIRRVVGETTAPLRRAGMLAAAVEILLAGGEADAAHDACRELDEAVERHDVDLLRGTAGRARGAVQLADGDAVSALTSARAALQTWQQLGARYDEARTRELVGLACRSLGDGDTASLELDAARAIFAELGAAPDLDRLDALVEQPPPRTRHGLTEREREILRLVASGRTNRRIAEELVLSTRTVDRHVSNIFAKLHVSSRAAATAYAYEHELV